MESLIAGVSFLAGSCFVVQGKHNVMGKKSQVMQAGSTFVFYVLNNRKSKSICIRTLNVNFMDEYFCVYF